MVNGYGTIPFWYACPCTPTITFVRLCFSRPHQNNPVCNPPLEKTPCTSGLGTRSAVVVLEHDVTSLDESVHKEVQAFFVFLLEQAVDTKECILVLEGNHSIATRIA